MPLIRVARLASRSNLININFMDQKTQKQTGKEALSVSLGEL